MFQGHEPYMKNDIFSLFLNPVASKFDESVFGVAVAHFRIIFWRLGPKTDHFGDPQKWHIFARSTLSSRSWSSFRTQGPPNQKKVGPEPARLFKCMQIWSKSGPKFNLKTRIAGKVHKLLQIWGSFLWAIGAEIRICRASYKNLKKILTE